MPSAVVRYGYAIMSVGLALAAALVLQAFDLEGFLFVIGVAVAVWLGGRGPGVLAVVLSILVLHFVFIRIRRDVLVHPPGGIGGAEW